jgi:hypothetical protein
LASTASSISFSSISGSYTDLKIIFKNQQSGGSDSRYLQINGDSSNSYSRTKIVGDGTSAYSGAQTSQTALRIAEGGSPQFPIWQTQIIDFFNYSGSTYKTFLISSTEPDAGAGQVFRGVGLWLNTSAITSITLALFAGVFAIGTSATLYGIKAA